jgi:drug/metabolite transporter (DMT)-like permease
MNSVLKEQRRSDIIAYVLLLLTALVWGGTWPVGRWLVSPEVGGETIPPLMIATIRYFIVVWLFIVLLKVTEGNLKIQIAKENWKLMAFMGLTSVTIYQAGYLFGEYFTAASDASVIVVTNTLWIIIISGVILKTEILNSQKIIGTILAFLGVIIIVGLSPNVDVPNRILGDILILIAAFSYAIYTVTSRYFITRDKGTGNQPSSLFLITWVSFFGFFTTLPFALLLNPEYLNPLQYFQIPSRVWWGLAYLIFLSTIGGYWFYLEGVKRLDASRASIFQALVPIFGVTLSALFLHEPIDILIHTPALLLVSIGIILVNYERKIKRS